MAAKNIDEVIEQLETIVSESTVLGNPLGIFASVYLGVTKDVKEGIRKGRFQDGARMERLDVHFANRYLKAYEQYCDGLPCTASWATAFKAAGHQDLLVLQHLLMGMNAHINLDLGIAAAKTAPGDDLAALEEDFMEINALLASRINRVQDKLSAVSPLLILLDYIGGFRDEKFAEFSLEKARDHAWKVAQRFAFLSRDEHAEAIVELDRKVSEFNQLISHPGRLIGAVLQVIKWFEKKDVKLIMKAMA